VEGGSETGGRKGFRGSAEIWEGGEGLPKGSRLMVILGDGGVVEESLNLMGENTREKAQGISHKRSHSGISNNTHKGGKRE